ncbi:hypothetical protein GPECTOR_59g682 [Gonium pectorale]|uniref:Uncharacterized protein n=1 Tax=Gonium pectorale TaxID=33097 RepID=A0A150G5M9_GONPE|nr:hypothetical protein GPECTOR_59g682 [Gonium pectorale]|eukprot:KXZ45073.1 hypothetical protein GPECTOR_59g682 [Gonium pectorale]
MRLCERNFAKKYLVGDALRAKCGAPIRIELRRSVAAAGAAAMAGHASAADGGTAAAVGGGGGAAEVVVEDEDDNVMLELVLLDGVMFRERGGDGRSLGPDDLRACTKLNNHRDEPLLQYKSGAAGGGAAAASRRILLRPERGVVTLPELTVTDSSEALLTGRKPPFRLLVSAVAADDPAAPLPGCAYAVSEDFVVATRRVKQANKADIPLLDDHVSKIEHIGRETVKKLADLRAAAAEMNVGLRLPEGAAYAVTSVGQFVGLAEAAEKDGQLKKVLQMILKLSKEKWEDAAAHAAQAVQSDFRRRVWYPPGTGTGGSQSIGLLFGCKYGAVLLREPVSLVHLSGGPVGGTLRITPEDELDSASLSVVRPLKQQAVAAWWAPNHPGWAIFKDADGAAAPGGAGVTSAAAATMQRRGSTAAGGGVGLQALAGLFAARTTGAAAAIGGAGGAGDRPGLLQLLRLRQALSGSGGVDGGGGSGGTGGGDAQALAALAAIRAAQLRAAQQGAQGGGGGGADGGGVLPPELGGLAVANLGAALGGLLQHQQLQQSQQPQQQQQPQQPVQGLPMALLEFAHQQHHRRAATAAAAAANGLRPATPPPGLLAPDPGAGAGGGPPPLESALALGEPPGGDAGDLTIAAAGSRKRARSPSPRSRSHPSPTRAGLPPGPESGQPPASPERTPSAHTATTGGAPTAQLLATITSFPSLTSCMASGAGPQTRGSLGIANLLPSFSFGPDGRLLLNSSLFAESGDGPAIHGVDNGGGGGGGAAGGDGDGAMGPPGVKVETDGGDEAAQRDRLDKGPFSSAHAAGEAVKEGRAEDGGDAGRGESTGRLDLPREPTLGQGLGEALGTGAAPKTLVPKEVPASEQDYTPFCAGLPPELLQEIAAQAAAADEEAAAKRRRLGRAPGSGGAAGSEAGGGGGGGVVRSRNSGASGVSAQARSQRQDGATPAASDGRGGGGGGGATASSSRGGGDGESRPPQHAAAVAGGGNAGRPSASGGSGSAGRAAADGSPAAHRLLRGAADAAIAGTGTGPFGGSAACATTPRGDTQQQQQQQQRPGAGAEAASGTGGDGGLRAPPSGDSAGVTGEGVASAAGSGGGGGGASAGTGRSPGGGKSAAGSGSAVGGGLGPAGQSSGVVQAGGLGPLLAAVAAATVQQEAEDLVGHAQSPGRGRESLPVAPPHGLQSDAASLSATLLLLQQEHQQQRLDHQQHQQRQRQEHHQRQQLAGLHAALAGAGLAAAGGPAQLGAQLVAALRAGSSGSGSGPIAGFPAMGLSHSLPVAALNGTGGGGSGGLGGLFDFGCGSGPAAAGADVGSLAAALAAAHHRRSEPMLRLGRGGGGGGMIAQPSVA